MGLPLIVVALLAYPVNSETGACPLDDAVQPTSEVDSLMQAMFLRKTLAVAHSASVKEDGMAVWPEDTQIPEKSLLQSETLGTSGGGSAAMDPVYGRIVTVGDSMFVASSGHRAAFIAALSGLLGTDVVVNAVSGASMGAISRQGSCSMDPECKWLVMNDAPASACGDDRWKQQFKNLLDRELAADRKIIIVGYPTFLALENDVPKYNLVMDLYKQAATDYENVWFVDPRDNPIWQSDLSWYARDKKHPAVKGEQVFAQGIAAIVKDNTGSTTSSMSTASTSSTPPPLTSSSPSTASTSGSTSMVSTAGSTSSATTSSSMSMTTGAAPDATVVIAKSCTDVGLESLSEIECKQYCISVVEETQKGSAWNGEPFMKRNSERLRTGCVLITSGPWAGGCMYNVHQSPHLREHQRSRQSGVCENRS